MEIPQQALEGRSTLSILTNFYQKEEACRQALAALCRNDANRDKTRAISSQPTALQPMKRRDTTEDTPTSVSSKRMSLPLKKRPCRVDYRTSGGKENFVCGSRDAKGARDPPQNDNTVQKVNEEFFISVDSMYKEQSTVLMQVSCSVQDPDGKELSLSVTRKDAKNCDLEMVGTINTRPPRTHGVPFKRDEHEKCCSVFGCEGDQGYGSHSVACGRARNTFALAEFLEKEGKDSITMEVVPNGEQSNVSENECCRNTDEEEKAVSCHLILLRSCQSTH